MGNALDGTIGGRKNGPKPNLPGPATLCKKLRISGRMRYHLRSACSTTGKSRRPEKKDWRDGVISGVISSGRAGTPCESERTKDWGLGIKKICEKGGDESLGVQKRRRERCLPWESLENMLSLSVERIWGGDNRLY